jgi:hypothetical protein
MLRLNSGIGDDYVLLQLNQVIHSGQACLIKYNLVDKQFRVNFYHYISTKNLYA